MAKYSKAKVRRAEASSNTQGSVVFRDPAQTDLYLAHLPKPIKQLLLSECFAFFDTVQVYKVLREKKKHGTWEFLCRYMAVECAKTYGKDHPDVARFMTMSREKV